MVNTNAQSVKIDSEVTQNILLILSARYVNQNYKFIKGEKLKRSFKNIH